MTLERFLRQYDYRVPPERIALAPARPRDRARLLVYDPSEGRVSFDAFRNLGSYLPKGALLIFNATKVIPARLTLTKPTGGTVRVLYLGTERKNIRALADRAVRHGDVLALTPRQTFTVVGRTGTAVLLAPHFSMKRIPAVLDRFGQTPLPPYLKRSPLTEAERRIQYQTVFARIRGSVAAPTASLHFTKRLLASLKSRGIASQFITLHVNLGTFAPLTDDQRKAKRLHREWYDVDDRTARAINAAKRAGRPIIAVGTTVARTLESAADRRGRVCAGTGETQLFIQPGYRFRIVDGLVTNFHVPRSSLMMLVSALTGRRELLRLYRLAIANRFRFFSFGDGMLILPSLPASHSLTLTAPFLILEALRSDRTRRSPKKPAMKAQISSLTPKAA